MSTPASDEQRTFTLVHDLVADIDRDLDAWRRNGDRDAGRRAAGDLDVVTRYLSDIRMWLLPSLVKNDPQYRPTDPVPERIIESGRGPGG